MDKNKANEMGKRGRKWTIENYSTLAVGKKLESILDAMPNIEYDFDLEDKKEGLHLEDLLDDGKRIAVVIPGSAGDVLWLNSLINNLKNLYKDYDIYVFTKNQFFDYIEDHPDIHKVLPYTKEIDNLHFLEGKGDYKGLFDIAFLPHYGTQVLINYHHNGKTKNQLELHES